jgi:hypothetical protein
LRLAGETACATKTNHVLAVVGQAVPPADHYALGVYRLKVNLL